MKYIYQNMEYCGSIQRVTKGILYLQDSGSIIPINLDDIVRADMSFLSSTPVGGGYIVTLFVLLKRSRQINVLLCINCYDAEVSSNMLEVLNSRFYTVESVPGMYWNNGFNFLNPYFDWSLGDQVPKREDFYYVMISQKDISPFKMTVPSYVINADFLDNVNNTKEISWKKK